MNRGGSGIEPPKSVEQVEELVKRLYQPGSPQYIVRVQDQLQQLQRSADGWRLADALLNSNHINVRFFGALTFQVKLNIDGQTLDGDNARSVLLRILHWLVELNRRNEVTLVQKKLCSALSTYFIQSPVSWQYPLLHLATCLQQGEALPDPKAITRGLRIEQLLPTLNAEQTTVLLWLASTIAEDLGRLDNVSPGNARIHTHMEKMAAHASTVMARVLQDGPLDVRIEAIKCFLTWVNYAQSMWAAKPEALEHLRQLIDLSIRCMLIPELERETLDVFRDILETYTTFFRPQHMQKIASLIRTHFEPKLVRAFQEKDPDGTLIAQLVIAYGCAAVHDLVQKPEDESSQAIMRFHLIILDAPGWPGDDDETSYLAIEFWNCYIEFITDTIFSLSEEDSRPAWEEIARQVLSRAVELLWIKMWTPPPEITGEWTDTERSRFKEFRTDASDLMVSIFVFLGRPMIEQFSALVLQSLQSKEWRAVEAAMYCMSSLADNVLEDSVSDPVLASVFGSSLFRDIADFDQPINAQTRRTAIDMLGNYGPYIERHPEFLPDTLRFLFASLETASLAQVAARSISRLCFTCRHSLTGELDGFLQQYRRFMAGPTSDAYNQEKVMGAIAAIIQALTPERAKAAPLTALLENVEVQIAEAKHHMVQGDREMAEVVGVGALNSLASIGRASQVPDDVPINLTDDESSTADTNFWTTETGQTVQQRIMNCFTILEIVGDSGDAIEAACQVLRSGYTEITPGPFVLPPSITVNFLQQCTVKTPQLESVLYTACMLITQHSSSSSTRIDEQVGSIFSQVLLLMEALGDSGEDPAVGQHCIDICGRLIPIYANLLFSRSSEQLKMALDFILDAMAGPDPLPKRSACEFWAKTVKLLGPQSNVEAHNVRPQVEEVITVFGPRLAETIMVQVSGKGNRSDVDSLCEPLKALTFYVPQSKAWLEAALFSDAVSPDNPTVSDLDKKRFLQQVVGLRGDKKTREVVKQFFIACRGTVNFN